MITRITVSVSDPSSGSFPLTSTHSIDACTNRVPASTTASTTQQRPRGQLSHASSLHRLAMGIYRNSIDGARGSCGESACRRAMQQRAVDSLSRCVMQADHGRRGRPAMGSGRGEGVMRHVPFFRWVLTLGVVLFGLAAYAYTSYPETRQIDLTVLSEKPDGRCTVRWEDRSATGITGVRALIGAIRTVTRLLKPSHDILGAVDGWESGFMFTEVGQGRVGLAARRHGSQRAVRHPGPDRRGPDRRGTCRGNIRSAMGVRGAHPRTMARARALRDEPTRWSVTTNEPAMPCAGRGTRCAATGSTPSSPPSPSGDWSEVRRTDRRCWRPASVPRATCSTPGRRAWRTWA